MTPTLRSALRVVASVAVLVGTTLGTYLAATYCHPVVAVVVLFGGLVALAHVVPVRTFEGVEEEEP